MSPVLTPHFTLRLINPRKAYWMRILSAVLTLSSSLLAIGVARLLMPLKLAVLEGIVIAGFIVPLGLIWLVYQRLTTDLCQVAVAADRLVVLKPRTQQALTVRYDEIMTYKYDVINRNLSLFLRLRDGHYAELKTDPIYQQTEDFYEMVRAFEVATGQAAPTPGTGATAHPAYAISREKTFFEKQLATYVLLVLVAGVGWFAWILISRDRPLVYLLYFVSVLGLYVYRWYQARFRRAE